MISFSNLLFKHNNVTTLQCDNAKMHYLNKRNKNILKIRRIFQKVIEYL